MGLNDKGDLAIAEVAFYSPAFLVGLYIVFKHGFARSSGWLYLVVLSILRLIGSSTTLYMETNNDYSQSLQETAFITSAVGTAPLLLCLLGLLQRLHASMGPSGYSQMIFRPITLLGLVALILSIVGGTKIQSSDQSSYNTGKDCLEAGAIVFVVIYLALAVFTILTVFKMKSIPTTERALIFASAGVLPVLAVRMAYTVAVSFSSAGSIFSFTNPSVVVQAVMQFAMEAIAIVIYSWAGLETPKAQPLYDAGRDIEEQKMNGSYGSQDTGYSRQPRVPQQQHQQQPQRNLGDYRPSRMIRNALRR